MKLSKVFGIVLSLHVGVILLVMFQPSCQTTTGSATENPNGETKEDSASVHSFNQGALETEPDTGKVVPKEDFQSPTRPSFTDDGIRPDPKEQASIAPAPGKVIVPSDNALSLLPRDLSIYKVVRGDTLWGIARKKGVSLTTLLDANPNIEKSARLSIGQEIMIPSQPNQPSPLSVPSLEQASPSDNQTSGATYVVRKGDTLSGIARAHGTLLSSLLVANGMTMSSVIRPGQVLALPEVDASVQPALSAGSSPLVPPGASTHIVGKGENLSRIASIYGVSVQQIMDWNGLTNPGLIRIGQPLLVSQGRENSPLIPEQKSVGEQLKPASTSDESGSLQDFFNEPSSAERPVVDAP